jgi:hypothetical protein
MTVAGFVSRVQKWTRFEAAWRANLPSTVSMFHMTDFVSSKNGWEGWRGSEHSVRRVKLIETLVSCVKANTNQGFAGSLRMEHYRQVNREYQLEEKLGSAYVFLAMGRLARLRVWADKKKVDYRKILCVFEEGDQGQGDLIRRARLEGANAVPQSKAEIRAFDACDLAAWKARTMIDDAWERELYLTDPEAAERILGSLSQLEKIVRGQEVGMYSAEALRKICEHLKIPKR